MNAPNEDLGSANSAAPSPQKDGAPGAAVVAQEERTWAMLAHLLGAVVTFMTGLMGGWIAPLIIWLVKKEESDFVADQGKEALNFQITMLIASAVALGLTIVSCGFLFPVMFVPLVLDIVFGIIAAVKANSGEYYRYPVTIRLIK